jgi:hypothetical protein
MVSINTRTILATSVACTAVNAGIRLAIGDIDDDETNQTLTLVLGTPVVIGTSLALLTNDNKFNLISVAPAIVMGIGAIGLGSVYWAAAKANADGRKRSR